MAMQALAVVPLFAGFDLIEAMAGSTIRRHWWALRRALIPRSRSGSMFARGSLKKLYRADMTSRPLLPRVLRRYTTPPTTTGYRWA